VSLPAPCRWLVEPESAYLYWHYACVGVVRLREGQWRVVLQWRRPMEAPVASQAQGMRFLERWVIARRAPPFARRKR
jgi:hypothetical protein